MFSPILLKNILIRFLKFWGKNKKNYKIYFCQNIFFLKMFWNVSEIFLVKSGAKKIVLGGLRSQVPIAMVLKLEYIFFNTFSSIAHLFRVLATFWRRGGEGWCVCMSLSRTGSKCQKILRIFYVMRIRKLKVILKKYSRKKILVKR